MSSAAVDRILPTAVTKNKTVFVDQSKPSVLPNAAANKANPPAAPKPSVLPKAAANHKPHKVEYEFGGPVGVVAIMIVSHFLILYVWMCFEYYGGQLAPLNMMWEHVSAGAAPTWLSFKIYFGFLVFQLAIAAFVPGFHLVGLPRVDRPGKDERLTYNCNAIQAWYITLVVAGVSHYFGWFDLSIVARNLGSLTIFSIIFSDVIAVIVHVYATTTGRQHRMTDSTIHDFFVGAWLHPRIGPIDLKMFGEIRWSWFILFYLTASAAVVQYQTYGTISTPMIFMLVAHFLYGNATSKGEEMVPASWDIVYEKWGWLLIFWNFAGVPFLYCSSSIYLSKVAPFEHSPLYTGFCFFLLFVGYYIFDTANSQKNSFRMRLKDPNWKPRRTFPQLPWGYLDASADCIKTKRGSTLLTDGWWKWLRKPHYVGDLMMTAGWGLITGFDSVVPWIYVFFFYSMLIHRRMRDEARCLENYGPEDWGRYTKKVPYIFIPGIF